MKRKIGVLALAATLILSTAAYAFAQAGGAGGGTGGSPGGSAAGTGATGNSSGVGGRGTTTAPSPNLNPSNPSSVPQSNEKPAYS
jgi:hypothetical protein